MRTLRLAVRDTPWPWMVVGAADAGMVVYGLLALRRPSMLTAGYEAQTGREWRTLAERSPETADHILLTYRLVAGLNISLGLVLTVLALCPFRRRERWAWYTLLLGNLIGYGAPMSYDRRTGGIGSFEALEYVGLAAVIGALAATAHRSGVPTQS